MSDDFDRFIDEFLDDDDKALLDRARNPKTGKRAMSQKELAQKRSAGIAAALKRTPQERREIALMGVAAKRRIAEERRARGEIPEGRHNRKEPSANALAPYYAQVDELYPDVEFSANERRAQALLLFRRDVAERSNGAS